ncbi:hypothetical protein LSI01_15760 [Furfurilactobacillus siliginis]|uniref:Uncharacterized protein n=1 Tax=Furfurilactobacillus siliginis TaxID=348151 RepID=A0A510VWA5_9LACO|nr:hypothetical protein LSI01_15760 [Furfurilactobacillus siliginis]
MNRLRARRQEQLCLLALFYISGIKLTSTPLKLRVVETWLRCYYICVGFN